jgi:hypothetical protein
MLVKLNGITLNWENYNVAEVMRKESVELNFTSEKKLLLVNILHVLDIKKNLAYANLLCKKGLRDVLELDKIILSKNKLFMRKGYSFNEMFKLGINNKVNL